MTGYLFKRTPQKVPFVNTKHRKIHTEIPSPGSEDILSDLDRFESRSMLGQLPLVWDRAVDFNVYDAKGNKWIDFTSTIFVTNVGHANKHVVSKLKEILDHNLMHSYAYATKIRANYIKRLVESSPSQFEKAFLLSAGTEATEAALKLMRMHGMKIGKKKPGIICFEGNWHGRTMGAQMMGGNLDQKKWIGYLDPNIYHLHFPYPWSLKNKTGEALFWDSIKQLEDKGVNLDADIAGFMIETFQGWGAVFYPKDYIQALDRFAKKKHILLSFDEMQSGFARTGRMFGHEHYDVQADLLCLGKGIANGAPLSAVIGSAEIMDLPEVGEMSSTHSANPISCAAGLATLEEIENRNLVEEAARKGELFFDQLNELQKKYPERINYVLGKGMVAAILFKNPVTEKADSKFASMIAEKAMQKGLLVVHTGRESIKLAPPLTIPDDAILEGVDVIEECLKELTTE
jgi:4-aminobutyrate aminotransferase-like enzyme